MKDINETLENLRGHYRDLALDIKDCDSDPVALFNKWMDDAIKSRCDEPNAFVLSTVRENFPHARVVLLKGILDEKFIFYTNYESSKGRDLSENNRVAMTFFWLPLQRQVRIEGVASFLPEDKSDEYFHKRPRGSQLGAIASPQSRKVESLESLEQSFLEVEEKFKEEELIPRPKNWGGYLITPQSIEFWQGRDNRMHDRILYENKGSIWSRYRLAP